MQQNFQTTKGAGNGANVGPGYPPNASWSNPERITTDDGSSASIGFFEGGQNGDTLVASQFGFNLPDFAVIDGVAVTVDGSNTGCFGTIQLNADLTGFKDVGALNQTYGGATDLWDAPEITPAEINDTGFGISIDLADVSGGDGAAGVDYVEITVFWHIELPAAPADVPNRVVHKVYSRDGAYLGDLPNPGPFAFSQDKDTAGAVLNLKCATKAENVTTTEPLLTGDEEIITTANDLPILAQVTDVIIARGNSNEDAIFKNSNRVKTYLYNYWHPNGKLMFSGQINKVRFQYGGGNSTVDLAILSDGLDMGNFIARGFPFNYTNDVSQTSQNGYVTVTQGSGKAAAQWQRYGQTWLTGGGVVNIGAITLRLQGTATVTLEIRDAPNGNVLGSVTKSVAAGSATNIDFEFAQLISVESAEEYFMAVSVAPGQSIRVYRHGTSGTYANGSMYSSSYAGGSGGGSYAAVSGDFYFVTKYGTPTTTTTYSTDDPVTEMMSGILADYNARGGYITERDFEATGLSLTYTFNQMTIYDALKKVLELSPTGYYSFIDLGTAEIDILPISETADFTVVKGRDVNQLSIELSIEQVKNYLLFTGGDTGGGTNLYREYQDSESASMYGQRVAVQADNRVTLSATADAIGETFTEENAAETQETSITVLNTTMDITLLTPGKTIGFRNFDNFIDSMVLQIVRRDFTPNAVTLTLGRLPVRMNDVVQRINRGLLNEQTINNPSAPS